ncbi:MAG: 4-phosphoerythronate dehydrogenase [Bacteroidetes bacterium]|nr:4-phosphoerythronate dehydrogenase [Bacteroidota bacterium]
MNIFSIDTNIPLLKEILLENNKTIYTFDSGQITNENLINTNTEFLIARSTLKVNKTLLENTNVKFVATATTGMEHFDIDYLNEKSIKYFGAIGANSNSVAEYIILTILFAFRHNYDDLRDKKVGIIGYGNIGSKVAYYLNEMGINYIICDPFKDIKHNYDINFLLKDCDIITLHIPLTTTGQHPTFNLLNKERIKIIKDNALLINSSRGNVCDEKELINNSNRLRYIIDTWSDEPNINNKLVDTALISTPHIAGHSYNGKLNATKMICEELNKLYNMKLNCNIFIQEEKNKIDMKNYKTLFETLSKNRKIIDTSNSIKTNIHKNNFDIYFNNFRKNYPNYLETLTCHCYKN